MPALSFAHLTKLVQPGRMKVELPADAIFEVGVPGVKGLNETLFSQAKVSDRKGVVATKQPHSAHAVGLTYCPNEIFVLVYSAARPEKEQQK